MTDTQNNRGALPRHGALNLLDGLLQNASIPTAAKARLRTIRLHLEALIEREQKPAAAQEVVGPLPCAFCGNAPALHQHRGVWRMHAVYHCETSGCPAQHARNVNGPGPSCYTYGTVAEALAGWNKRAAPVAAAPVDEFKGVAERAVLAFTRVAQELGIEPAGGAEAALEAIAKLRTPAAPGIDLEPLIAIRNRLHQMSAANDLGDGWADVVIELMGDVQKLIDASPKGDDAQDDRFPNGLAEAVTYADAMEDAAADLYQHVLGYETDGSETGTDMLRTVLRELQDSPKGGSDAGMADEYRRWIDFYHAGGTGAFGYEDFLKREQATSAEVGA